MNQTRETHATLSDMFPQNFCLADPLTKHSAKPDHLLKIVTTGVIEHCDEHPPFALPEGLTCRAKYSLCGVVTFGGAIPQPLFSRSTSYLHGHPSSGISRRPRAPPLACQVGLNLLPKIQQKALPIKWAKLIIISRPDSDSHTPKEPVFCRLFSGLVGGFRVRLGPCLPKWVQENRKHNKRNPNRLRLVLEVLGDFNLQKKNIQPANI